MNECGGKSRLPVLAAITCALPWTLIGAQSTRETYQVQLGNMKVVLSVNIMELAVILILLILLGAAVFFALFARSRAKSAALANKGLKIEAEERQRALDALKESREWYRALAESIPHLVWTSNPDGRCDYLSHQWFEYTGRPAEEQLALGWAEALHPEDREYAAGRWAEAVAQGTPFELQFRIRRADGVYRWFGSRAVPLRDGMGGVRKWFGTNTDFEDYKAAQQKLHGQLARLSLLDQITRAIGERLDLASVFQVTVRALEDSLPIDFGCFCLFDPVAEKLTVTSVGAVTEPLAVELNMTENAQISIRSNALDRCVDGQLIYQPDMRQSEYPFWRRFAQAGICSLVASPLRSESGVFGILMTARRQPDAFSSGDCEFLRQLTEHVALAARQAQVYAALQQAYDELRQTQESVMEQERLRTLGQMASGIAHDINNALSPVALYTESLLEREPGLSSRMREYLETTQRAIGDVAHTVGRMREFYRQREAQLPLVPVDVNRVAKQVLDLTRARWSDMPQQRGIVIEVHAELGSDLPKIAGSESEIREALTNLIFNAVDAMPNGGVLTVRTMAEEASTAHGRPRVHLEIMDTGIGMDEATRRRCLEPFFSTKGERGTGLGLAMVYGIAQRHNAEIEIETAPGKGTILRLTFPVPATLPGEPSELAYTHDPPTHLRLLVVDDDPLILKSLRAILEIDGHIVVSAGGGREAIEVLQVAAERNEPFAAVITDLGMPHVDGRQVATAAKMIWRTTPVILLTGWGQRLSSDEDVPPNVNRVLNKPPKLQQLRSALAELVSASDSRDSSYAVKST